MGLGLSESAVMVRWCMDLTGCHGSAANEVSRKEAWVDGEPVTPVNLMGKARVQLLFAGKQKS